MMREPAFSLLPRPAPRPLHGLRVLVLGLGDTGLSLARWVERQGASPRVADTRAAPPRARDYPGELHCGPFRPELLNGVDLVCVSPGLPLAQPLIVEAVQRKGRRVSICSTIRTQPPMVADELRRQADNFIELEELKPMIMREGGGRQTMYAQNHHTENA